MQAKGGEFVFGEAVITENSLTLRYQEVVDGEIMELHQPVVYANDHTLYASKDDVGLNYHFSESTAGRVLLNLEVSSAQYGKRELNLVCRVKGL